MQRHIPRRESIRPAQCAHGDVLRCPVTDARQGFERFNRALYIGTAIELQAAARNGPCQTDDGHLPLPDDAQLAQRVTAGLGQYRR